jgi:hypothetical protein
MGGIRSPRFVSREVDHWIWTDSAAEGWSVAGTDGLDGVAHAVDTNGAVAGLDIGPTDGGQVCVHGKRDRLS